MRQNSYLEAEGFPPPRQVFPIGSFELSVLAGEHSFLADNRDAIADNWRAEYAANPNLFDGRMVFQRRLSFRDGHIAGEAHLTPFSAYLYWRRAQRMAGGLHLFGLPVVLSSDGALISVRMAETTANPGRVYCAAGSLDEHDIVEGRCDLASNMRREVLEETGLDLAEAEADARYFATHDDNTVTIFRTYRFDLTADALLDRIAAHVASETEPEISGALAIRTADPHAHPYAFFMLPILDWLFDPQGES